MQNTDLMQRVRDYVTQNFLYMRPDFPLGEDDRLLGRGVLDSMGVLELIAFLGDEFGIDVADDEITEANLGTLRSITNYVASKVAASGGEALHRVRTG